MSLLWIPQAALLAWGVQQLSEGGGLAAMMAPAIGFLLLGLVRATGDAWAARRLFHHARAIVAHQRAAAAVALASRSPLDAARPASGQAASALAEQAEAMLPWLLRYRPARRRALIVPAVIAAAVGAVSWLAALILVAAAPLIPLFMALIGRRAQAASEAQLQAQGGMNGFLLDRLRGLSTLRSLGAIDRTAHRLRESAESLRGSTMRVLRVAFLSSTALELFSSLAVAMVAVYVGFHLLGDIAPGSWGKPLTLGEGLFILLLAPAFFEPLRELSAVWHDKAAGEAARNALASLRRPGLPLPGAMTPHPPPARPASTAPSVDLQHLSFRHGAAPLLFDDARFQIGAGEHVAVVGTSGAGKTTLLSIIAGLAPLSAGEVRIDGVAMTPSNAGALRARMAWIGQRPHVFPGTVRDNVSLNRPGVSSIAVAGALRRAALGTVGTAMPSGTLGEGGTGLSGGELVRLSLARAAATPHADLLLADEPTAHLDLVTAGLVIEALLQLAQGRTLIVATHDLALAARMGRVIRIGDADAGAEAGAVAQRQVA